MTFNDGQSCQLDDGANWGTPHKENLLFVSAQGSKKEESYSVGPAEVELHELQASSFALCQDPMESHVCKCIDDYDAELATTDVLPHVNSAEGTTATPSSNCSAHFSQASDNFDEQSHNENGDSRTFAEDCAFLSPHNQDNIEEGFPLHCSVADAISSSNGSEQFSQASDHSCQQSHSEYGDSTTLVDKCTFPSAHSQNGVEEGFPLGCSVLDEMNSSNGSAKFLQASDHSVQQSHSENGDSRTFVEECTFTSPHCQDNVEEGFELGCYDEASGSASSNYQDSYHSSQQSDRSNFDSAPLVESGFSACVQANAHTEEEGRFMQTNNFSNDFDDWASDSPPGDYSMEVSHASDNSSQPVKGWNSANNDDESPCASVPVQDITIDKGRFATTDNAVSDGCGGEGSRSASGIHLTLFSHASLHSCQQSRCDSIGGDSSASVEDQDDSDLSIPMIDKNAMKAEVVMDMVLSSLPPPEASDTKDLAASSQGQGRRWGKFFSFGRKSSTDTLPEQADKELECNVPTIQEINSSGAMPANDADEVGSIGVCTGSQALFSPSKEEELVQKANSEFDAEPNNNDDNAVNALSGHTGEFHPGSKKQVLQRADIDFTQEFHEDEIHHDSEGSAECDGVELKEQASKHLAPAGKLLKDDSEQNELTNSSQREIPCSSVAINENFSDEMEEKGKTEVWDAKQEAAEGEAESGDEYSSSESGESSDSDEDGDDGKPFKLVIKEAPLLRLENVTAQTRSSIDTKSPKMSGGSGKSWGWFGFGKKSSDILPTVQFDSSEQQDVNIPPLCPDKSASEGEGSQSSQKDGQLEFTKSCSKTAAATYASTSERVMEIIDASTTTNPEEKECAHSTSLHPTAFVNAPLPSVLPQTSEKPQISGASQVEKSPIIKKAVLEMHESLSEVQGEMEKDDNHVELHSPISSALNENHELPSLAKEDEKLLEPTSHAKVETMPSSQTQALSQANEKPVCKLGSSEGNTPSKAESPQEKKKKKKNSKEKNELSKHFGKKLRKVNRHGDEVSVGTMKSPVRPTARHVVIAKPLDLFVEDEEQSKHQRPWEKALSKQSRSLDAVRRPLIIDELDVAEAATALSEPDHESDSGCMQVDASRHSKKAGEELNPSQQCDDSMSQNGKESKDDSSDFAEERDELTSLLTFNELESRFSQSVGKEVNFEEMWDTVSCDGSTAVEFEVRKREKEKAREKKKIYQAKARAEKKAKAIPRLHLFEKEDVMSAKYGNGADYRLSNEFLIAIERVFDEEALDDECGSDQEHSIVELPEGDLMGHNSLRSLYLITDLPVPVASEHQQSSKSVLEDDEEENDATNSRQSNQPSSKASKSHKGVHRAHSKASSKRSKMSKSSRLSHRSRQPDVDPAAIFEEELKRQQGTKVLSVSSLRQEMSDRRGTSVRLLEKEFAERKKQNEDSLGQAGVAQIDFTNPGKVIQKSAFSSEDEDFDFFGTHPTETSGLFSSGQKLEGIDKAISMEEGTGAGAFGELATRWDTSESVTDLDDLKTIIHGADPSPTAMGMVSSALSHLPATSINLPTIAELSPHLPNLAGKVPNMPNLPSMPSLPGFSGSSPTSPTLGTARKPGLPAALPTSPGSPGTFSFGATFNDMPLTTIREQNDDDENEKGLLSASGIWDDEEGGGLSPAEHAQSRNNAGGGGSGRFSLGIKAPTINLASAGKKLEKIKSLIPKIPKRSQAPGGMNFIGDNDERGLLG